MKHTLINCHICKKYGDKYTTDKNSRKVRERFHYTINTELPHIVYVII